MLSSFFRILDPICAGELDEGLCVRGGSHRVESEDVFLTLLESLVLPWSLINTTLHDRTRQLRKLHDTTRHHSTRHDNTGHHTILLDTTRRTRYSYHSAPQNDTRYHPTPHTTHTNLNYITDSTVTYTAQSPWADPRGETTAKRQMQLQI